jgi:dystroglycan 1
MDCFCSGVADTCQSSDYYRIQLSKNFGAEGPGELGIRSKEMDHPARPRGSPRQGSGRVVFDSFDGAPLNEALYWELPSFFHGDRVTAYGGGIKYKVSFSGAGSENREPDVVIRGNNVILYYYHWAGIEPDMDQQVTVNMYESNWRQPDGNEATRPQLMMALSDLDTILLKISYRQHMTTAAYVLRILY